LDKQELSDWLEWDEKPTYCPECGHVCYPSSPLEATVTYVCPECNWRKGVGVQKRIGLYWWIYQKLGALCLLFPREWELRLIVRMMDWCVERMEALDE